MITSAFEPANSLSNSNSTDGVVMSYSTFETVTDPILPASSVIFIVISYTPSLKVAGLLKTSAPLLSSSPLSPSKLVLLSVAKTETAVKNTVPISHKFDSSISYPIIFKS